MKLAVLSDIHGNLIALERVIEDMKQRGIEQCVLLGDLVDYCMQSNEVIDCLCDKERFPFEVIASIRGNHERAILEGDFNGFSSQRGTESAKHTAEILTERSYQYLRDTMESSGQQEIELCGCRALLVHASLEDVFWKAVWPENVHGDYSKYDIVISGHSHFSHCFSKLYEADAPEERNRHAVLFVNPGSIGQPRNHNPHAQYAILDAESLSVELRAIPYDVEKAMSLFDGSVDDFYRTRLKNGV